MYLCIYVLRNYHFVLIMKFINTIEDCDYHYNNTTKLVDEYYELLKVYNEKTSPDEAYHLLEELDYKYYLVSKFVYLCNMTVLLHHDMDLKFYVSAKQVEITQAITKNSTDINLYNIFLTALKKEDLDEEDKHYITSNIQNMKKLGVKLSEDDKEKLQVLTQEEMLIKQAFITNATQPAQLTLKPDPGLEFASEKTVTVSLNQGNYNYIMNNSEVEENRRNCYREQNFVFLKENNDLMDQYILKRNQIAKILGFNNASDYDLVDQGLKNGDELEEYLYQLLFEQTEKFEHETELLLKKQQDLDMGDELYPWNIPYLKTKVLEEQSVETGKHFPFKYTFNQMIKLVSQFFNLKLEPFSKKEISEDMGLWDNKLKIFKVSQNHEFLGHIIMDLFGRKNKGNGSMTMGIQNRSKMQANKDSALAVVVVNISEKFFSYEGLKLLFHETGHAIHQLLSNSKWTTSSNIVSCATDYMEFPSQLFEKFLGDKEILQFLSKDVLSQEVLDKLISKNNIFYCYDRNRQILLSLFSHMLFKDHCVSKERRRELMETLHSECYEDVVYDDICDLTTRFIHLCEYGSKYYSYLWCNQVAIDVFNKINKEGSPSLIHKSSPNYIQLLSYGGGLSTRQLLDGFFQQE
jgi:Zn-dependent oligopeptidase